MPDLKKINPKKILIINPYGIGDVLFTLPFIENIKLSLPGACIDFLANQRTKTVLSNSPHIGQIIIYDRDEFNSVYKRSKIAFLKKIIGFLSVIKKERYDVAFDFSLNSSSSFFMWLLGIKHRIGFNYRNRSFLLTYPIPLFGFDDKHVVEYYLEILERININADVKKISIPVHPEDALWADSFLKENGLKRGDKIIGVIPGGGASWGKEAKYRRWSAEKYGKLVDKMIEKFRCPIILMGDKIEEELCRQVVQNASSRVIQANGKTEIGQLLALLSRCSLVVLNDGGPLHMAVAVGTKTVSIFGPVDENVYGPYGDPQRHLVANREIACRPCYRRFRMTSCDHVSCLSLLEVEDVLEKVEKIL